MSSLGFIPEVQWSDFEKVVKTGSLVELKSCEVYIEGDYLFTAIIGHTDIDSKTYARTQSEYLAVKTNITGGKEAQELIPLPMTPAERMAKARAARRPKVAVGV